MRPISASRARAGHSHRAVDGEGQTIDFLLTPHRDKLPLRPFCTRRFVPTGFRKRSRLIRVAATLPLSSSLTRPNKMAIAIRQSKYLNNIVEQDHRAVKRVVKLMLGFKSFWAARCTIADMEVMHALRKGQLGNTGEVYQTPAEALSTHWRRNEPGG